MSNIRLIISDIDGTILTSNHQVDEQLIWLSNALKQPIAHKVNPILYDGKGDSDYHE